MPSDSCFPPTTKEVDFEIFKTTSGTVYERRNLCQTTMDCFLLPNSTSLGQLDFVKCAEAASIGGLSTVIFKSKLISQSTSSQKTLIYQSVYP